MTSIDPAAPTNGHLAVRPPTERPRPVTDAVAAVGLGVVIGWCAVVAGAAMILIGYLRVDSSDSLAEQFAYFSSACVGGLALIGIGGLAVLARQHADARRAVEEIRRRRAGMAGASPRLAPTSRPSGGGPVRLVAAPGTTTYHRADCVFVAGVAEVAPVLDTDGMRPCQVCAPPAR